MKTATAHNSGQTGAFTFTPKFPPPRFDLQTYRPGCELLGAFAGMPMRDYLAAPGINSSAVKDILESPLNYKRKCDGLIQNKQTTATEMGTALHAAILEGKLDFYTEPLTYGPDSKKWNNNATECKAWNASHCDKPVLSAREAAFVSESFNYVKTHPKCGHLLTGGHSEISIFAEVDGVLFKCRPDYYKPGVITDLKSVADASTRGFSKAVPDWGWHIQAAINVKCCAALGVPVRFNWIALQKGDMPLLNVVKASQAWLNLGETAIRDALHIKAQCEANNFWPEWPDYDGTNDIQDLPVPHWMLAEENVTVKVGGIEMNL